MIKGKITGELNFPVLNFQKDLEHIAKRIFIPYMAEGIQSGRAIDGGRFPPLSPATLRAKKGPKTLIESGKLHRSFRSRPQGMNRVIIDLSSDRQEIGDKLQLIGVGRNKKKFKFFGVNSVMAQRAINYMNLVVRRATKRGGRRTIVR